MFAEVDFSGITFDPSVLEAFVLALLTVGGLAYLVNKLTSHSPPFESMEGQREMIPLGSLPSTPSNARAKPVPAAADSAGPPPRVCLASLRSGDLARPIITPRDRRRHMRRKGKPVKALLLKPTGGPERISCWVVDRSRNGLGLVIKKPLAVGTRYDIRAVHAPEDLPRITIEVRNCRPRGHVWRAGCKFTTDLPWSVLLLFG
jgi:hypothetical protein